MVRLHNTLMSGPIHIAKITQNFTASISMMYTAAAADDDDNDDVAYFLFFHLQQNK